MLATGRFVRPVDKVGMIPRLPGLVVRAEIPPVTARLAGGDGLQIAAVGMCASTWAFEANRRCVYDCRSKVCRAFLKTL